MNELGDDIAFNSYAHALAYDPTEQGENVARLDEAAGHFDVLSAGSDFGAISQAFTFIQEVIEVIAGAAIGAGAHVLSLDVLRQSDTSSTPLYKFRQDTGVGEDWRRKDIRATYIVSLEGGRKPGVEIAGHEPLSCGDAPGSMIRFPARAWHRRVPVAGDMKDEDDKPEAKLELVFFVGFTRGETKRTKR